MDKFKFIIIVILTLLLILYGYNSYMNYHYNKMMYAQIHDINNKLDNIDDDLNDLYNLKSLNSIEYDLDEIKESLDNLNYR